MPLFAAMRKNSTHPLAQQALDRVLRDEAVHRAFGWNCLDEFLSRDQARTQQWAEHNVPQWLPWFRKAYGDLPNNVKELTPIERSYGLIDATDYETIYTKTMREDIIPRFKKRGIQISG